jgi:exodeoxyribonuclease III
MEIVTWNVNSLRVRLPQLLEWLSANQPDIVALQETKVLDEAFPGAEIAAAGYQVVFNGPKTYNGVAILARTPLSAAVIEIPNFDDQQRRVLAASCAGVRVVNLYVPNGQAPGTDKYEYKLRWLQALRVWLRAELAQYPQLLVLGDFNIAPEDRAGAHGARRAAADRLARRVPPVRSAAAELQLVGLPGRCVPAQSRPAHRPDPGSLGTGAALHGLPHRSPGTQRRTGFRSRAGHRQL